MRASLFITCNTHTHSLGRMSERGEALSVRERDTEAVEIIFMFSGFTATIGSHSISEEVAGFFPLWFSPGNFFVSLFSCVYCCACYSLS